MSGKQGVAVVGSANLDLVVSVDRFPLPGETVVGERYEEVAGGKGLNQAVAAAANGPAALVACVGADEAGGRLLEHLIARGVDVRHVGRVDTATGRAFIQVSADGENNIVVAALANRRLDRESVETALGHLRPGVVLAQLEVPAESVAAAAAWSATAGSRFVLNASPVHPLPTSLVAAADPLVVNIVEAERYVRDLEATAPTDVAELARVLAATAASVVVTAGERGAYIAAHGQAPRHIPAPSVDVVDTTGAGDEFAGTLACALSRGETLQRAAELATEAASRVLPIPRHER